MPLTRDAFRFDTIMLEGTPGDTVTMRGTKSGAGCASISPISRIWASGPATGRRSWRWSRGMDTRPLDTEDDVFEHKRGIIMLEPGAVDKRSFHHHPALGVQRQDVVYIRRVTNWEASRMLWIA